MLKLGKAVKLDNVHESKVNLVNIHLTTEDIEQMPEPGRTWFLNWLPEHLKAKPRKSHQASINEKPAPVQLKLALKERTKKKSERSHTRLTELFDAGITKPGMSVRVKLKGNRVKELGREYINGLEISPKGTVIYKGKEFDKVSPLAQAFNYGSTNGWSYIEVKKDGQWICLNELRKPLKSSHI